MKHRNVRKTTDAALAVSSLAAPAAACERT